MSAIWAAKSRFQSPSLSLEEDRPMRKNLVVCFLSCFVFLATLAAQAPAPDQPPAKSTGQVPEAKPTPPPPADLPATSVTRHSVKVGGRILDYTATAAVMPMKDDSGKIVADIFYIAYTFDGVMDRTKRPVLFAFNGGPGSASVWMHMGFLGPRKVVYSEEGWALRPPYRIEDNSFSILDEADIVFIDPVATGYSRMAPGEDPHTFHGVAEDLDSVAEFIRLYLTKNGRWDSPKFLIGESYGTTRAAGLTGRLMSKYNIFLNGTILVSSMTLGVRLGADTETALILPHYTATAWYHKKLPADLQAKPLRDVLDESEAFALGEFLLALARGNTLSPREKDDIAAKLARFSGLSPEYLKNRNLRVEAPQFRKELLRKEGLVVGRLDSRYTGIVKSASGEEFEDDPAMTDWFGGFTGAINQYFKNELKVETDLNYNIFGDVGRWRGMNMFGETTGSEGGMFGPPQSVGEMLYQAMAKNRFQKVLVLAGYYDGACDYFSAEYAFTHLDPAGAVKDRVKFAFYECGHMMYIRGADLAAAKGDLAAFIRSCLSD
jgi:carboxypeptidase C (cathepsin A)